MSQVLALGMHGETEENELRHKTKTRPEDKAAQKASTQQQANPFLGVCVQEIDLCVAGYSINLGTVIYWKNLFLVGVWLSPSTYL